MMKAMKKKTGFTLLELLIVIAIIGILASLATVSYASAQKKARDSQRQSDLKAIQNALEQYYADNQGSYPTSCAAIGEATDEVGDLYLPMGLPTDPKTDTAYTNTGTCSASSYRVCADLENDGTFTGEEEDFCVTNLQ